MSDRILRLEFDELPDDLRQLLKPRVDRLNYLGEFFKVAGSQPEALIGFITFTEKAKAALPKKIVETIALTAAGRLENAYERNQHERLSIRLGFGHDWVRDVEKLDPKNADSLSREEKAVQTYTLAVIDSYGKEAGPLLEPVIDDLGPDGAVAVMMVVGRYLAHSVFANTLDFDPAVPSIWEDGFGQDKGA